MNSKEIIDNLHNEIKLLGKNNNETISKLNRAIGLSNRKWLIDESFEDYEGSKIQAAINKRIDEIIKDYDIENLDTIQELEKKAVQKIKYLCAIGQPKFLEHDEPIELFDDDNDLVYYIDFYKNIEYAIAEADHDYAEELTNNIHDQYQKMQQFKEDRESAKRKAEEIKMKGNKPMEIEKAKETLKELHNTLEEEKEIDKEMAERIQKYIEYENKKWIIEHKKEEPTRVSGENNLEFLVACKLSELTNTIDLEDDATFETVSRAIASKLDSINEDNLMQFNNSILLSAEDGEKTVVINCFKGLENYIILEDPEYADYLDKQVDWFYENYKKHEQNLKAQSEEEKQKLEEPIKRSSRKDTQVITAEPVEIESIEEDKPKRKITSLSEWVQELGNYVVEDGKRLVRK